MTNLDLYDWAKANACEFETPQNTLNLSGAYIKAYNKHTRSLFAYLELPLDDRCIRSSKVKYFCDKVGIPTPEVILKEIQQK